MNISFKTIAVLLGSTVFLPVILPGHPPDLWAQQPSLPTNLTTNPPAEPEPPPPYLAGHPRVVDGDSLAFGLAGRPTVHVRLWGIDAPESRQTCRTAGTPPYGGYDWPAGQIAKRGLTNLIGDLTVTCQQQAWDSKYRRPLSRCWVPRPPSDQPRDAAAGNNLELNAMLVERGLAWAYRHYTDHYGSIEDTARQAKRGIHGYDCIPAWQWRRERH